MAHIGFKTLDLNSAEFQVYLPLPPVFVCKDKVKLVVGVLRVDIVDPGHQVGQVDPVAEHPEEHIIGDVGRYCQA